MEVTAEMEWFLWGLGDDCSDDDCDTSGVCWVVIVGRETAVWLWNFINPDFCFGYFEFSSNTHSHTYTHTHNSSLFT